MKLDFIYGRESNSQMSRDLLLYNLLDFTDNNFAKDPED